MGKEEMIRKLVQHSVKTALAESKHYWLCDVFEKGFTGYRNLSRAQLTQELQLRGLAKNEAEFDDDDLDDIDLEDYSEPPLELPMRAGSFE
jgi:hypothetical protein